MAEGEQRAGGGDPDVEVPAQRGIVAPLQLGPVRGGGEPGPVGAHQQAVDRQRLVRVQRRGLDDLVHPGAQRGVRVRDAGHGPDGVRRQLPAGAGEAAVPQLDAAARTRGGQRAVRAPGPVPEGEQ